MSVQPWVIRPQPIHGCVTTVRPIRLWYWTSFTLMLPSFFHSKELVSVKARRGFTLIELLVVIAIIAVLIALASGRPVGSRGSSPHSMHEQPEAIRPGVAQLHFGDQRRTAGRRHDNGLLQGRTAGSTFDLDVLECPSPALALYGAGTALQRR